VLEGESLVNDGIGLVAYKLALTALATGAFSLVGAAGRVAAVSAGGIAVGLVVGWLVARLRRRLDDAEVEITISLLTPYAAYILAERIGASGVLATVAAGLYLGSTSAGLFSPQVRLQAQAFWSTLAFLLNSVLFLLVGLQFRRILQGIATDPVNRVAGAAAGVALTVVLVRILWQELMPRGTLTRAERLAVGWSGMRGAVSLAAALALPLDVPRRDLLLFLTFCTVFVTLVVQGLTLPALLRRLGVAEADEVHRREVRARRRVVHSALGRLEELAAERDVPEAAVERLRERYEGRLAQLDATLEDVEADTTRAEEADAYRDLREDLIDVQRSTLTKLQRRGAVDASTAQRIGRELDLDQVRQYESR
jgi:CPA1 family monovalent cation:H+ antiporter